MNYSTAALDDRNLPRAAFPFAQHLVDVYVSEVNKVASVWRAFSDADLAYRPHERSMTVSDVFKHELLSARRFFGGFLGLAEPSADAVLDGTGSVQEWVSRLAGLARPRVAQLAAQPETWWLETVPFFDVERQRIWIFWRRVLHTAHHRTQLTVYLRLLGKPVPAIYGPTADVKWEGADPTTSTAAAGRR